MIGSPTITLEDDETAPEVILTVAPGTIRESDASATQVTVSAHLDPNVVLPDDATIVSLSLGGSATAGTGGDYTAAWDSQTPQITIPQGQRDGSATVTLTLTPQQDLVAEGDETIVVEGTASTGLVVDVRGSIVTLEDDDIPGLVLDPKSMEVTEGSTRSYTVALTLEPTEIVTVTMTTSLGATDLSVDRTILQFTPDTWNAPQEVRVTAAEDTDAVADATLTLAHEASGGAYEDVSSDLTVTIKENDAPNVTVSPTTLPIIEGMSGMYSVVLTSEPTADVTVTMATNLAGTDLSVSPSPAALVFTADNWNDPQTVTVNAAVDADAVTDPAVTLTHTVTSTGDYNGVAASDVLVTIGETTVPELSIASSSQTEGAGTIGFAVTLSAASDQPVTVEYGTQGVTATQGTDYTGATGTVTFAAMETGKTISVALTDDTLDEINETFTVTLSNPSANATVSASAGTATGTITDDDNAPAVGLAAAAASAEEGESLSFEVRLGAASAKTVTVAYATTGVTATQGTDYTGASGTLTFAPGGALGQTITVLTAEDALDEADETFALALSGAANAILGTASATGTITDDDDAPTVGLASAAASGEEGTSLAFEVRLGAASGKTVTVAYATAGGTATQGTDYTGASGTLTFAPGGTLSRTITVATTEDALDEDSETFTLTLSSPGSATLGTALATGTITDDDDAPTVGLASVAASAAEGDSLAFEVRLGAASGKTVTVAYATTGGTATQGTDYTGASGTLTFAPGGALSQMVTVVTTEDALDEADETFTLTLSGVANATLGTASATGTITDDDAAPAVGLASAAASGEEGTSLSFEVRLGAASAKTVTVAYATTGVTATQGTDYTGASGTLTFAPGGALSQMVPVATTEDALDEADETFTLTLSSPANAMLGTATATGTITDDDDAPGVGLASASASGEEGTSLSFEVRLGAASAKTVTVAYATSGATATQGTDYTAASGTLTFAPGGALNQTVTVATTEDALDEPDETFTLTLSGAANAMLGTATATGTITDDDDAPGVGLASASASAEEGASLSFEVRLGAASAKTVTVAYATSGATATQGTDYTAASGTLTFAPGGALSQAVTVATTEDALDEPDETFTLDAQRRRERDAGDGYGDGHDHGRRRRAGSGPGERFGERGGRGQPFLRGAAGSGEREDGDGGVRDVGGDGDAGDGLHGGERDADVRARGASQPGDHGGDDGGRAGRAGRDLHA